MVETTATGTVLPPGTAAPKILTPGEAKILVEAVDPENGYDAEGKPRPSEHFMARCVYPDGWVKAHQVKTIEDLLPRIVNQLRWRFGITEVKFIQTPSELKAGVTITVEV
jgi:hypothetical protein